MIRLLCTHFIIMSHFLAVVRPSHTPRGFLCVCSPSSQSHTSVLSLKLRPTGTQWQPIVLDTPPVLKWKHFVFYTRRRLGSAERANDFKTISWRGLIISPSSVSDCRFRCLSVTRRTAGTPSQSAADWPHTRPLVVGSQHPIFQ